MRPWIGNLGGFTGLVAFGDAERGGIDVPHPMPE